MISKSLFKYVKSLQLKKNRQKEELFLVEGEKSVCELLKSSLKVEMLFASDAFTVANHKQISEKVTQLHTASANELQQLGTLQTNEAALALVHFPNYPPPTWNHRYMLALDGIRDPGNLGTIIRIADWYGVGQIIASNDTVDVFNPKVINSTMGSFTRVAIYYQDLLEFFTASEVPLIAAAMSGESLHQFTWPEKGIICIGNESKGISDELMTMAAHKVTIPHFGAAESLNAGIATALFCDGMRRSHPN